MRRAEQQIEIAERIEVAEVGAVGRDALVVGAAQHLGAAQRVLDRLPEQPREGQAEELVAEQVEEAHRLLLHRVDQPHAVDELALAGARARRRSAAGPRAAR